jgi:hypothetical protein
MERFEIPFICLMIGQLSGLLSLNSLTGHSICGWDKLYTQYEVVCDIGH